MKIEITLSVLITFALSPMAQAVSPAPDGGYAGAKLKAALAGQPVELEIVKRTDNDAGFKVVRRRWVIERTLSWLRRNRRLMAHYEAFALIAEGFAKLAMICVMLKRITEPTPTCAM